MKRLIFDANFLIDLFRFKIPLEELNRTLEDNFQMFTVDKVVWELEKMAGKKTNVSKFARLALNFLKANNVFILKSDIKNTDDALIDVAHNDSIIATDDVNLRKRLKTKGIKTIYLRAKKKMAMS